MSKNLQLLHFIILGFLRHKSFSGYDLKKVINNQIGFFYPQQSFGKIYRYLENLNEFGLIRYSDEPSHKRDGTSIRTYSVTDKGVSILEDWLVSPISKEVRLNKFSVIIPQDSDKSKNLTKMNFFSGNLLSYLSILLIKSFFFGKIHEKRKKDIFTLFDDFKNNILQKLQPTLEFSEGNLRSSLNEPEHKYFLITLLFGKNLIETITDWEIEINEILK